MNKIGKLNQTGEQNQIIKRYILHFDLNKTIILSDTAKDASKDEIVILINNVSYTKCCVITHGANQMTKTNGN